VDPEGHEAVPEDAGKVSPSVAALRWKTFPLARLFDCQAPSAGSIPEDCAIIRPNGGAGNLRTYFAAVSWRFPPAPAATGLSSQIALALSVLFR
jgi:hypothetical protein